MKGKYLEFTLKDGKTKVEAHGYTGKACRDASFGFEQELGFVDKRIEKPDAQKTGQKLREK